MNSNGNNGESMNNVVDTEQKPTIVDQREIESQGPSTGGVQIKTEVNIKHEIKTEADEYESDNGNVVDSKQAIRKLVQTIKTE